MNSRGFSNSKFILIFQPSGDSPHLFYSPKCALTKRNRFLLYGMIKNTYSLNAIQPFINQDFIYIYIKRFQNDILLQSLVTGGKWCLQKVIIRLYLSPFLQLVGIPHVVIFSEGGGENTYSSSNNRFWTFNSQFFCIKEVFRQSFLHM